MITHKYPYTDLTDLNLDWLLNEMRQLEARINGIYEELKGELTAELKAYVDAEIEQTEQEFAQLKRYVEDEVAELISDYDDLSSQMQDYIDYINGQIRDIRDTLNAEIIGVNARTDALIASNNEYLLSQMSQYLSNIKVINYFTGELVSIQDMFNYLAGLHLTDSIDYDTMAYRAKTYTQLAGLNINYTNLALHGNTLYV